jgi:hypothetical protein
MEYEIFGLKLHHYIGHETEGNNCHFKEKKVKSIKYIVCLKSKSDQMEKNYELELSTESGQCSSGWTVAQWGLHKMSEVSSFGAITHKIKAELNATITYNSSLDKYKCQFFEYSHYGNDVWYPYGYIYVDMSKFQSTLRGFDQKPIWVFSGPSNLGKSFLAHKMNNMTIYETDSSDQLPDQIESDIIVIGNKYKYTKGEIANKIMDAKLIYVDFHE